MESDRNELAPVSPTNIFEVFEDQYHPKAELGTYYNKSPTFREETDKEEEVGEFENGDPFTHHTVLRTNSIDDRTELKQEESGSKLVEE